MANSACYVVCRSDGYWYAVVGGRDLGCFPRRRDAEQRARERADAMGLASVTVMPQPPQISPVSPAGAR